MSIGWIIGAFITYAVWVFGISQLMDFGDEGDIGFTILGLAIGIVLCAAAWPAVLLIGVAYFAAKQLSKMKRP